MTATQSPTQARHRRPTLQDTPVAGVPMPSATERRGHSQSVMTRAQRVQYLGLVTLWVATVAWFWVWWLHPAHRGNTVLFSMLSAPLFYVATVLPSFYLFYLFHMRRPRPAPRIVPGQSTAVGEVAVITLTVPGSESVDIVRRQLVAMTGIRFPHDSWILVDKVHSPEIRQMAEELGVRYFSRHDVESWGPDQVAAWNQDGPPFQAKTKAGNVNAWLDAYGDRYTHFTQLDIDHNPRPDYLDQVLGHFTDPGVAWVQAPSVYGNFEHWTARGSAEQELVLQGPLQMGFYGFCETPFIIGSHCTYDTRAVESIGGFQPTRAEDHLDTVILASKGRRGVFVPETIATGDGPESFETYLAQQFAWAYSMIQVLLRFTPRLIRKYTPRQALQFLFVQTWYTFWSLSMLALFVVPIAAVVSNTPISHVNPWVFLAHSLPPALVSGAIWFWSRTWHKPQRVGLSWRGIVLHTARWIVVLSALVQVVFRVKKPYMITVKGMADGKPKAIRLAVLAPYLVMTAISLGACWFSITYYRHSSTQGVLFFVLENVLFLLLLLVAVCYQDLRALGRRGVGLLGGIRLGAAGWVSVVLVTGLLTTTSVACAARILRAFTG